MISLASAIYSRISFLWNPSPSVILACSRLPPALRSDLISSVNTDISLILFGSSPFLLSLFSFRFVFVKWESDDLRSKFLLRQKVYWNAWICVRVFVRCDGPCLFFSLSLSVSECPFIRWLSIGLSNYLHVCKYVWVPSPHSLSLSVYLSVFLPLSPHLLPSPLPSIPPSRLPSFTSPSIHPKTGSHRSAPCPALPLSQPLSPYPSPLPSH